MPKKVFENEKKTRYAVIYDVKIDPQTGKSYMKQKSFPTNEEADQFLEELGSDKSEISILLGTEQKEQQAKKVRFNEFLEDSFYGEQAHMISNQTFRVKQALLNKHIVPYFSGKYLHEITEQEIAELFAEKDREGYSKSTIKNIHGILSTLFRSAVQRGYLDKNPVRFMKKVKTPNGITKVLSESEVKKLLEVAHLAGEGIMYELEIYTGLRLAELLALSWSDIDLDKQTIIVKKNVANEGHGTHTIMGMKSGSRKVVILSYLLPMLQKHKEEQQLMKKELGDRYDNEFDLVFPKKDGGVQSPSAVRARFNRLVEQAGIQKITFHDLRRTHASLLVKAGVPLYLVRKQMGYKSVDTLFHFLPQQFPDSMKSIKLFRGNDKEDDFDKKLPNDL
ncbi:MULTISPECIES: tyrosine-type recombinase/integrase [Pontibacillus]|uniref:Tyr recombinase domain-containing protein n=1 Tax=Pontibacillus marinus BH030004 = DSM 16465 TaxID=1385511 RepID=A0A0A5GDK9_9BACI|nr:MULTISPECIES: site-specific integrase [Pontibacillus]KGX90054.1 hypothetical protein N783_02555 [Pontibacillus marinus BH030004 = DSM 16465]QHE50891.1 tyrosine-type recombinase/integrase [Pontibacillus sp. HMF3514]